MFASNTLLSSGAFAGAGVRKFLQLAIGVAAITLGFLFLTAQPASAGDGCVAPTLPENCVINKDGSFTGYKTPWPPNCIYIVGGYGGATRTSTGNLVVNPNDRTQGRTTGAPQCRPAPCPKAFERCDYPERGHRMQNVGSYIDKNGCSYWYDAEGNPLPPRCNQFRGDGFGESSGPDAGGVNGQEANFSVGWIDQVTCDGVQGWAYDADNITAPVTIHLYVDGKAGTGRLLTSGATDMLRTDINDLFGITGNHGFTIKLPDTVRDGKAHTMYAYAIDTNGGENRALGGGGKTFNCTGTTGVVSTNPVPVPVVDKTVPVGWLDSVNCTEFRGWAFDPDNAAAVMDVHFYIDGQAGKGGVLIGMAKTTAQRDDINTLYKLTGTHGFVFTVKTAATNPLVLSDGKAHPVYAYAINTNGGTNPLLGGTPKSVTCTAVAGGGPGGAGGGGGGSGRHNTLSSCDGHYVYNDQTDPALAAVIGADGKVNFTYQAPKNGAATKIFVNGKEVTWPVTINPGDIVTVETGGMKFVVDTDGLKAGETSSVLIPMPCIRIGYNDVAAGTGGAETNNSDSETCSTPGNDATCRDALDAFINIDVVQNAGLHIDDPNNSTDAPDNFTIEYKVKGDKTNIPWRPYDWRNCQGYINHCIVLRGKGVVYARTIITGANSLGLGIGHRSITSAKEFDAGAPR